MLWERGKERRGERKGLLKDCTYHDRFRGFHFGPDFQALGRISGGLYIVTAAKDCSRDVGQLLKSAMVASWVSQASFEPLGLSIAVAKDRAIESFMQVTECVTRDRYVCMA